jgi:hypothetical protein
MNVLQVVGRTYSSPHKYFYRQMTHGIWTPWEPVDLEISGDHIVLAHWRDRLYIFWVTFLDKKKESEAKQDNTPNPDEDATLTQATLKTLRSATGGVPKSALLVKLHWSEYLGDGWSSPSSSNFRQFDMPAGNAEINVHSLTTAQDETVQIFLTGAVNATFVLRGRNSPVELNPADAEKLNAPGAKYTMGGNGQALTVSFAPVLTSINGGTSTGTESTTTVLGTSVGTPKLVHPANSVDLGGPDIGPLVSPFFYEDSRRTFFVQPYLREDTIAESTEKWTLVETSPPPKKGAQFRVDLVPQAPIPSVRLHPPLDEFVEVRQRMRDVVINPSTAVVVDDRLIGARGVLPITTVANADTITELRAAPADNIADVVGISPAQAVAGNAGAIVNGGDGGLQVVQDVAHPDGLVVQGVLHVDPVGIANAGLIANGPIQVIGKAGLARQFNVMQFHP